MHQWASLSLLSTAVARPLDVLALSRFGPQTHPHNMRDGDLVRTGPATPSPTAVAVEMVTGNTQLDVRGARVNVLHGGKHEPVRQYLKMDRTLPS